MDDFDWDGETLAIGDDEGASLVLEVDPNHENLGLSTPGNLSAMTDFINHGVFNGNFRLGPPDPSQNLSSTQTVTGSNFMPGWRFIRSSNNNIEVSQVRDTSSPSGSNLRFTFSAGATSDAAMVEQIIDIGGSRTRQTGDFVRGSGVLVSGTNVQLRLRTQYLTVDGSIAGMPAEKVSDQFGVGVAYSENAASDVAPPGSARYLRLRVEAYRTSGTSAASIDLTEVRRARGYARIPVLDESPAPSYALPWIGNGDGLPYATSPRATDPESQMLLGFQLVPIAFVLTNVPANTTTEMQPSDVALGLGTPRVRMPWPGHIVGMSYRLSGNITAGTMSLQATVSGSNVWTAHSLASGSSQHAASTQPIGTDLTDTSGAVGVQVVTNGAYLPTTLELHVLLWLALEFDGL